jgi:MoxR-like ATPase
MEPAPTGGLSASPRVPSGIPNGHEGAAEGKEARAVGEHVDDTVDETLVTRNVPGAQPAPIVSNGTPIIGDSNGRGPFSRGGYPADNSLAAGSTPSSGGPFSPNSSVSPTGPFGDNATVSGQFAFPAGSGIPLGPVSPEAPVTERPATQQSNGAGESAVSLHGTEGWHHNGSGNDQPAPPTGTPVANQPPPPTGNPVAGRLGDQSGSAPAGTQVYMPPPPPSGQPLSLLPPPPSGSPVSKLPPPPTGTTVKMPPMADVDPPEEAQGNEAQGNEAPHSVPAGAAGPIFTFSPLGSIVETVPEPLTGLEKAKRLDDAIQLGQALVANLRHVVLGTPGAITAVAVAALCGGHLLIEDVPGVGKTVLAQALAASLGSDLSRLQGHPDLLPSDVTGVSVFSPDKGTWEFKPGPVFAHVVLVDELNRTPPRTQAALLETMEEQQVSADGESFPLPIPHLVIATQNPHSQLGTYPLVESQLDRFALATAIGYPDADVETQIVLQHGGRPALPDLRPVCTPEQWLDAQLATQTVVVEEAVAGYAVALCRASRHVSGVRLGASPRAAIWLVRTAQAHAVLSGRAYVTPGDVKAMALSCLSHRLTTDEGVAFGVKVVRALLESTPTPRP